MNAMRPRIPRRAVHGVLLLDKPLGLSSNDALALQHHSSRARVALARAISADNSAARSVVRSNWKCSVGTV